MNQCNAQAGTYCCVRPEGHEGKHWTRTERVTNTEKVTNTDTVTDARNVFLYTRRYEFTSIYGPVTAKHFA